MKTSTKIFAALGIVAGFGVAVAPLASYADASDTVNISVLIDETLSCEVTDGESLQKTIQNNGAVADGVLGTSVVNVKTNHASGYVLTMVGSGTSGANANSLYANSGNNEIPSGVPAVGVSAFGYKVGDATNYTGVPDEDTNIKTSSLPTNASGENTSVTFAVTASASQAAGSYSGEVTFTATTM